MRSTQGDALTELVLPVFELNGEFLEAAKDITEPSGLTPAWWQVLGATMTEPLTVADIARRVGLGLARQSVQRTADILVDRGWAEYVENPKHKRAKLLRPTKTGMTTVRELRDRQHDWSNTVGEAIGVEELLAFRKTLDKITAASRAYRDAATPAQFL